MITQPFRSVPDPRDAALDDTIESSFPASDPPSSIPDPAYKETDRFAYDRPLFSRIDVALGAAAGALLAIAAYRVLSARR
jgi:hypothetical protein